MEYAISIFEKLKDDYDLGYLQAHRYNSHVIFSDSAQINRRDAYLEKCDFAIGALRQAQKFQEDLTLLLEKDKKRCLVEGYEIGVKLEKQKYTTRR